jgi:hypothetical protein
MIPGAPKGQGSGAKPGGTRSGTSSFAGRRRTRRMAAVGRVRERGLPPPEAQRKPLALVSGKAPERRSQKMLATIDTPQAPESSGRRLARGEAGVGNLRAQKRREHLPLRGRITGTIQGRLSSLVHHREKLRP